MLSGLLKLFGAIGIIDHQPSTFARIAVGNRGTNATPPGTGNNGNFAFQTHQRILSYSYI
jgi:hypothetical protein